MTALRSGSATDVGRVRTSNQDVALEESDLFAVADGMGGHVGGEVAARVAVDALRASFRRQPSVEGLRRAVAEANRAVWHQGQTESGLRGMGTTLTATALVDDGEHQVIALANVGDSRAYVFSRGQVIQVTADHSLAEEKVRQGELTEEEAAVHPHRHILTRALGVSSDVDVDLWELHLQLGDRILLCSDGLTNEVDDRRIGQILANVGDPHEAASSLVRAALDHGGSDNVTVVVVDVVTDDQAPPPRPDAAGDGAAVPGVLGVAAVAGGAVGAAGAAGGAAGEPGAGGPASPPGPAAPNTPAAEARAGGGVLLADAPTAAADATGTVPTTAGAAAGADATGVVPTAAPRRGGRPSPLGVGTAPWAPPSPPRRPTRRERRRQRRMAGVPRLVTIRVVLFFVLLGAVVYAAYYLVRWYANDDWYVTVDHSHLVVYRGRPGGFLWFKPHVIDRSAVTTTQVLAFHLQTLHHDVQQPSAAAAKQYIATLHQEFVASQQLGSGQTPTTTPTTTTPTTAAPAATSTTAPAG